MKILIVEDDVNSRIYLERALLSQGYLVESAVNGVRALEKAAKSPPDLIISDIMMPEMDGFELCRKVKTDEQLRTIPFVFYTATYIEQKDERLAMALGASRFLIKPIELDDLFTAIKSVVDEYRKRSLEVPAKPIAATRELDRMQLEVLARKLDKKVRQLEVEREVSQKRENKYRKLLESMMDGFAYVDMDGMVRETNETYKKMLGYSDDELKRLSYNDITPEKWHGIEQKIIQEQVLARGFSDIYETEYRRKDGVIFPVELHSFLIKNEQGEKEGMWTIVRDITNRKQAEEQLKKAAEEWRATFNSTSDLFLLIDKNYRITQANKAVCEFLNLPVEKIIGNNCYELMHGTSCPLPECPLSKLLRSVKHEETELYLKAQNIWVQVTVDPILDEQSELLGFVHIVRNITERKRLEDQLRQSQKMEAIGTLAGGIAHDINNMLGVILGHTELILGEMEPEDSNYEDLEEVLKAARRSADLTQQLLAFARKQTIEPMVLDLNDTVDGMLKMLKRLIGEDIELIWRPETDIWPVKMDPAQLDQILANLCVNARDAIPGVGKVTIETENVSLDKAYCADHFGFKPGRYVMLAVSDNGCGMDKETVDRIFEPFFTTKESGKGSGLGLSTVYGIVKQNGGFINVYSEPGQGSSFKIYICVHEGGVAEEIGMTAEDSLLGEGETILLVEDEQGLLTMGQRMLEKLKYDVLTAASPHEAMALAKKSSNKIHLLITDVVMPKMSGKDLAERIKTLNPNIKVLFMSGYTANVIAHHGVLDQGVHFIAKPFSIRSLSTKVRKVLNHQL